MRVHCQQVSKEFASRNGSILALEDITLETEEREFVCILGPSGCGKTTLLRIIAGLLKPTAGQVSYRCTMPRQGPETALVFQEHGVFPWMNVIDNVCFSLEARGVARRERHRIAMPLIERMGLGGFLKSFPHQLSAGMKQRVGLARALVSGADLLLMDEPFASLDAQMRLMLQEEVLDLHREYRKSVIYVTHDIEEAVLLADRVVLLTARPGRIRDELRIPLDRPRSMDGHQADEFIRLKRRIWTQIKEEVLEGSQPAAS